MVWASLLGALSRVGDVAAMNRAVDMMQASNAPGNPSTYAILIDFYGKHQRLTAMNAACRAMDAAGIPRTIQTYTCMPLNLLLNFFGRVGGSGAKPVRAPCVVEFVVPFRFNLDCFQPTLRSPPPPFANAFRSLQPSLTPLARRRTLWR